MKSEKIHFLTLSILVVGGLNWGLTSAGIMNGDRVMFNLFYQFSNSIGLPLLEAIVYLVVGLSALYQIFFHYQESFIE